MALTEVTLRVLPPTRISATNRPGSPASLFLRSCRPAPACAVSFFAEGADLFAGDAPAAGRPPTAADPRDPPRSAAPRTPSGAAGRLRRKLAPGPHPARQEPHIGGTTMDDTRCHDF